MIPFLKKVTPGIYRQTALFVVIMLLASEDIKQKQNERTFVVIPFHKKVTPGIYRQIAQFVVISFLTKVTPAI